MNLKHSALDFSFYNVSVLSSMNGGFDAALDSNNGNARLSRSVRFLPAISGAVRRDIVSAVQGVNREVALVQ